MTLSNQNGDLKILWTYRCPVLQNSEENVNKVIPEKTQDQKVFQHKKAEGRTSTKTL